MEFKDLQKLLPTVTEKSVQAEVVDSRGKPIEKVELGEGLMELVDRAEIIMKMIDENAPF